MDPTLRTADAAAPEVPPVDELVLDVAVVLEAVPTDDEQPARHARATTNGPMSCNRRLVICGL